MVTPRRSFLPREGLYIDPIVTGLRKTVLYPGFSIPAWCVAQKAGIASPLYMRLAQYLAIASALLWLNTYLSRQSRNNWTIDHMWNGDWTKEIVVVTGGSGGLGAGVAQQLAAMGARVVVVDILPLTYVPESDRITYYQCDLSDENQIASLCEKIRSEVGDPSVLVNNAGLSRGQTVAEGTYHDNSITFKTNLLAPFLLTKEFLPGMIHRQHGHIVNVSSTSAYIPPAGLADYAASKAGLIVFHECLSQELKFRHNAPKIRTSLLVLSFTKTPMFKGETNQSHFFMPLLHADTVVDAIVDTLVGGLSRTIYLPGIFRLFAGLRGAPEWFQTLIRDRSQSLAVDFKGRQKIDPVAGKLV